MEHEPSNLKRPFEGYASTSYYSNDGDDETSVNETSFRNTEAESSNETERKPSSKHVIAGVPEGFFDDEKLDSRV